MHFFGPGLPKKTEMKDHLIVAQANVACADAVLAKENVCPPISTSERPKNIPKQAFVLVARSCGVIYTVDPPAFWNRTLRGVRMNFAAKSNMQKPGEGQDRGEKRLSEL